MGVVAVTPFLRWAETHQISPAALAALLNLMGAGAPDFKPAPGKLHSEAGVQQQVRLVAARKGWRLWRNNVGACEDKEGRIIRYGLCNESAQMNAQIKSSDLVGITPTVCRCGWRYGVFTAFEIKAPKWHLTPGDKRAQAQLTFIQTVIGAGGIARFVTNPAQVEQL